MSPNLTRWWLTARDYWKKSCDFDFHDSYTICWIRTQTHKLSSTSSLKVNDIQTELKELKWKLYSLPLYKTQNSINMGYVCSGYFNGSILYTHIKLLKHVSSKICPKVKHVGLLKYVSPFSGHQVLKSKGGEDQEQNFWSTIIISLCELRLLFTLVLWYLRNLYKNLRLQVLTKKFIIESMESLR